MANRSRNLDNGLGCRRPLRSYWTLPIFILRLLNLIILMVESAKKIKWGTASYRRWRHTGDVDYACSWRGFDLLWQRCWQRGTTRTQELKKARIVLLCSLDLFAFDRTDRSSQFARYAGKQADTVLGPLPCAVTCPVTSLSRLITKYVLNNTPLPRLPIP